MSQIAFDNPIATSDDFEPGEAVTWLSSALAGAVGRLLDSGDHPLMDLPLAQLRVALTLFAEEADDGSDEAVSMTRLSVRLGVRMNALTQAVDRLAGRGLVERERDATDRRVVRLRLTELGRTWVEDRRERRRRRLVKIWDQLSPRSRRELIDAVKTLKSAAAMAADLAPESAEPDVNGWNDRAATTGPATDTPQSRPQ